MPVLGLLENIVNAGRLARRVEAGSCRGDHEANMLKFDAELHLERNTHGEELFKDTFEAGHDEKSEHDADPVVEQEIKIRKMQEKIALVPTTKKSKPAITKNKEALELLTGDGNDRAALDPVRKAEEAEWEKIGVERDKLEGGGLALKKVVEKKVKAAPVADDGVFEVHHEVLGIVQSVIEGSEDATATLSAGPWSAKYKSKISVSSDRISLKLKRPASREFALKTLRVPLWNPPTVLPTLSGVLLLLEEKLKSEPSGSARELCMELCTTGPGREAAAELVLPMFLSCSHRICSNSQLEGGKLAS